MSQMPKSKLNPGSKPFVPGSSAPKSNIPKAPPLPGKSTFQKAGAKLDSDEKSGGHSRSRHVGMSDTALKNRNIKTATTFKTGHDQNKVAAKGLGTTAVNKATNKAISSGKNQAVTISGKEGRTASIARVAQNGQTFNAKVTETKMVMKGGTGKVLTTYPSKFEALEKPLPKNAPRPEKPKLGAGQTDFSNVTKNAKPGMVKPKTTTPPPKTAPKPAPKSYASALNSKK